MEDMMGDCENLQKYISEYVGDKPIDEWKLEFQDNPELYYEIAKYKGYGVPKRYKKAVNKYFVVENLFFFESNLARQYSGNPRYIYEKLIERFPNFIYVWAYDGNPKNIPGNPIVVKRSSNEYYKYLAKARVIINNTTFPIYIHREDTFYLQTWHGTPYKLLHWDKNNEKKSNPQFYIKSRGWNALLSPNNYSTEKFKSAFRYDGEILELGYPANDIFYNKEKYDAKRDEVRNKLGISSDNLVYLYAPTWRDEGHLGNSKFKFNLMLNTEKFLEHAPQGSILLVRGHHMSEVTEELKHLHGSSIDVSEWDDVVEIICAADVLITDYSSIVFDWYCTKKPVLYYVPDLKHYENKLRGSYFDIHKINCGSVCETEEELYKNINVDDAPFYEEFYNIFCSVHNGESADKVVDFLIKRKKIPFKNKIYQNIKKVYRLIKKVYRKIFNCIF